MAPKPETSKIGPGAENPTIGSKLPRLAPKEGLRAGPKKEPAGPSHEAEELSLIGNLVKLTSSVSGVREFLGAVLDQCMQMAKAEAGSVFLFDRETQQLVLSVARGQKSQQLQGVRRRLGEGVAGYVAQQREPIFVTDIRDDSRFSKSGSTRHISPSFLCVPIVSGTQLFGVLSLTNKSNGEPFNREDLRRLLVAASYCGPALDRLCRHDRLVDSNEDLHRRLNVTVERLQEANEELIRLKNYNESIVRSIPLGLLVFDADGRVTYCNREMRDLLGLADAVRSVTLKKLAATVDDVPLGGVVRAAMGRGEVRSFEEATLVAGDRQHIVHAMVSPLRDGEYRIVGGLLLVSDVTDQAQMRRQLGMAERHAVIGKLAARVAHELNNPLDGIIRFINLSLSQVKDERIGDYLNESKRGLERMAGIVSSLLEFSRNAFPSYHHSNVNQITEEAVKALYHKLASNRVEIRTDFAPDIPAFPCGDLIQVFINLIKNALDAMPQGGCLHLASRLDHGAVEVTVADSGVGIPPDIIKRIFDPFFTTKDVGQGTGLGLAICQDIVEKHGGGISVQSESGVGTTFTVRVPIPSAAAPSPREEGESRHA